MGLTGNTISNPNRRLHFLLIVFFAVIAFGSVLYWRHQSLIAADYVQFNQTSASEPKSNNSNLRSRNYQIETFDVSPTVN